MAYPYYASPYTQPYQPYQPQVQQQPVYQGGIIWVSGFEEASAYPIAPNTVIPMWDRNSQTVYWKQSDAAGRQSIRVLDYKERTGQEQVPAEQPVTKEDLAQVLEAIRGLEALVKGGGGND